MGKLRGSLLILYLTAAAGYGGWRGPDLWSGWSVWCFLLPPLAWAALKAVGEWRRNPSWVSVKIGLVMTAAAVVAIGGQALALAWVIAEASGRWSPEPAVRTVTGAGLFFAAGSLAVAAHRFGKPAGPREGNGGENTRGPAEPGAAPDRGGS